MAALPYVPLYVADYLADTAHLEAQEHGAYLMLIFNYWQRGKPLPDDDRKLARIARVDDGAWAGVRAEIAGFFEIIDGEWRHSRIEAELAKVHDKSNKARAAGQRSASLRSTPVEQTLSERSTDVEPMLNHTDTDTDTEKKKRQARERTAEFLIFWNAYPRKVARDAAAKAYLKARDKADEAAILAGVEAYKRNKPAYADWAHAASWLNAGRWADEYADAKPSAASPEPLAIDEDQIRKYLRDHAETEYWPGGLIQARIGPPPGWTGCRIAPHLLAEYERMKAEAA